LIEDGAPEMLMRRRGAYYQLVDRELSRLAKRAA
jgi:ABC-type multidrug transport system fused ATPase/permease subunit